jgi:hypothetical protein
MLFVFPLKLNQHRFKSHSSFIFCVFDMKISFPILHPRLAHLRALTALCGLLVCLSCSVVQPVRVLPEGVTQGSVALGGPWLPNSSPAYIVPYLNIGAMHGVSENVTLVGNLHGTIAAFGVLGLDFGAAYRLIKQQGAVPELTAKAQVYGFVDLAGGGTTARPSSIDGATSSGAVRIYPHITLNGSYELTKDLLGYVALENTLQFGEKFGYFFSPGIGLQYSFSPNTSIQAEWKWSAANVDTRYGIFRGQSAIGGNGNWGIFLGFNFFLGGRTTPASTTDTK